jgi:uncharacterized phage protein (TIGR01671 family)
MSREIKFKIWYKKGWGEKMTQPFTANQFAHRVPTNISECGILLQFTGLHDKNGVPIYEGDIVRCFDISNHVVEFCNGAFGYTVEKIITIAFQYNTNFAWRKNQSDGIEVIGNIYENPELLQQ